MNNEEMINNLIKWLKSLTEAAVEDADTDIFWFGDTAASSLSIIGGWENGFSKEYDDLLYLSKRNPNYAMCVKIALNDGPYAYTDFELMNMPIDQHGFVEDTLTALEHEDNLEDLATWLASEWERLTLTYGN